MSRNKELSFANTNKSQKKIRKLFIYLIIGALFLLGALYQKWSIYYHANEYGRVGQLVEMSDTSMHLYTSGSSILPFVFASNIGVVSPYVEMQPLVKALPEDTALAVYDKPGYGWSEVTKAPRDIDTITKEIHTLLQSSDQRSPFILIAHSMGSLEIIRYAQIYPDEVAGIVLIDGASPEFCSSFNNIMIAESFIMNALRNTGIMRLLRHTDMIEKTLIPNSAMPADLQTINEGLALEKIWNRNIIEEKLKLQANAQTVIEAGSIGDIPLRIITSKANPYGGWKESQAKLLNLSSDSAQTFIDGSVNYIEEKDIKAISEVLNELKTSLMPEEE